MKVWYALFKKMGGSGLQVIYLGGEMKEGI